MASRLNNFNPLWMRDPEFKKWVERVPSYPHKASCMLCERDFAIGGQGHHALEAHAASSRHKMRVQMTGSGDHGHRSTDRALSSRLSQDRRSSDRMPSSRLNHDRHSSDRMPNSPGGSASNADPLAHEQVSQLSRFERDDHLAPLLDNGWNLVDGRDAVNKTFLFQSFNEAWSWMSRVALAGERMGHHPEWFNVYNTVQITWTTPECNGLSVRDIKMAHFCDSTFKYYK